MKRPAEGDSAEKGQEKQQLWRALPIIAPEEAPQLQALMDKNFGLSPADFEQLVERLNEGDDQLFEQIFLKHFDDAHRYIMRQYKANHEDAYDACMNTLLEFYKRLKAGKIKYGNLRFLFTRMAGQIYLKWIKKEQLLSPLLDIDLDEAPAQFEEAMFQALDKAWLEMGASCKTVLKDYYYEGVPLKEIAERIERSAVAVRKQKQRCIEKLRQLFAKYY
ncbi:MAG: sigma-70 family RNA polymerase sigma factor [Bacteroidota bacterium]